MGVHTTQQSYFLGSSLLQPRQAFPGSMAAMVPSQASVRLLALVLSLGLWLANARSLTSNATFDALFTEPSYFPGDVGPVLGLLDKL